MASAGRGRVPGCRHGCARVELRVGHEFAVGGPTECGGRGRRRGTHWSSRKVTRLGPGSALLGGTSHPSGDRHFEPMNQGTHPEELPAEVLADVASVVGAEVTLLSRLPGGFDVGALRVQLAGRANAVLKAWPRARPNQLDETLRTQRVVEHMRRRGYPTPAWLGVGATATHVWHLIDFVDAAPAPELTPSLVEQLMEINELQAGQASEPYDHWSYAWRLATGQESGQDLAPSLSRAVAGLSGYSSVVSALVERLRLVCGDVPPPREAPDMVHADFKPDNVLVRDGVVVAVVDIGNAGSGTRATDLTTLQWHTFQDPLLTVSEGGCGRESSIWSAGRGRRCSQRHRSS